MNAEKIAQAIINDLNRVADSEPNEVYPKEDQIRCTVFNLLKKNSELVCAERGYKSNKLKGRKESDLWIKEKNGKVTWIEIKRVAVCSGYVPHADQIELWNKDLEKLSTQDQADRYFVLVGIFDAYPCGPIKRFDGKERRSIVRKLRTFSIQKRIVIKIQKFKWCDDFSHIGVWIWYWAANEPIGRF